MQLFSVKWPDAFGLLPLLVFGTGLCLTSNAVGSDAPMFVLPKCGICAHRGASRTHPENTIPAFKEAIRLGAHQIEFDVYLTKDKQLVVIHDKTVDRTTNGTGRVSELTFEEIRQLDAGSWKARKFSGQRVPTLQETLAVMPANIWLNVHLKGGAQLGSRVAEVIVREGRTHQAFLAANRLTADAARKVEPTILICNMERQEQVAQYVQNTIAHDDQFLQLKSRLASSESMQQLKVASVNVNYCCTNDPRSLQHLYDAGVQFPLVDDVGGMMEAAVKLGIEPLEPIYRSDRDSP